MAISSIKKRTQTGIWLSLALTTSASVIANPLIVPPELAEDNVYNYQQINNVDPNVETLTTDLFGDKIDPGSGSIRFTQTDVSLPGNFNLPVAITRSLSDPSSWHSATREFGNWSIELPHVRSNYVTELNLDYKFAYWPNGEACSRPLNSNPRFTRSTPGGSTYYLDEDDYWNGDTVFIPGKGSTKLLTRDGDLTYKRYNNLNWEVNCWNDPAKNHEGFEVVTGDGTHYFFSEQVIRRDDENINMRPVVREDDCQDVQCLSLGADGASSEFKRPQFYIFMLVTRVEDKFGNSVDYSYDNGKLTGITASDGRTIGITYIGGKVDKVTANGRQWQYGYDTEGGLNSVALPNGQSWFFDNGGNQYGLWRELFLPYMLYSDECIAGLQADLHHFITMTHPYGMKGQFNVNANCVSQAEVPEIRQVNPLNAENQTHWVKRENRNIVIDEKILTFPDNSTYTWDYSYSNNKGYFVGETIVNCPAASGARCHTVSFNGTQRADLRTMRITHPDSSYEISYFDRTYGKEDGNLLYQETYESNGTLLQRISYDYDYSEVYGNNKSRVNIENSPDFAVIPKKAYNDEQLTRTILRTVELFNAAGNSLGVYSQTVSDFDNYNQPLAAQGTFAGQSRHIRYAYQYDLSNGVFNLPLRTQVSDQPISAADTTTNVVSLTTYKQLSAQNTALVPDEELSFGQWKQKFVDYHTVAGAIGLPKRVEYNAPLTTGTGNRFVEYYDYKRGIPQEVRLPGRYSTATQSAYRTVDNNGWVTSFTDFNGHITRYGYDGAGRFSYIDSPNSWLDTVYTWSQLVGQGPRRQASRCVLDAATKLCSGPSQYFERLNFDSLLRPTLTERSDGVQTRYQAKRFDHKNQETFTSYWSSTAAETSGTTRIFDALQRLRSESQSGGGTVSFDYLANNRMQVTDARNNVTTTTFQAFGVPEYKKPTLIASPENVTTSLNVDELGLIHSITKSGNGKSHTEYRAYNSVKQLCKVSRGDVGQTVYTRNALGQIEIQEQGATGGAVSNCAYMPSADGPFNFTYDNLGDTYQVSYSDGITPQLTYQFDKNGNLTSLTSGSAVQQIYTYNSLNLLESEILVVEGKRIAPNASAVSLDYEYDSLGALEALTYPDGDRLTFAPNGFGEPTQAIRQANAALGRERQVYADSAVYYPTGNIDSFNYGNGISHKTLLNDRMIPRNIKDAAGSTFTALELSYVYDNNLNVTSIVNDRNLSFSLTNLSYDDLDRLTSTTGNAGIGSSSVTYDALGNITAYSSKDRNFSYHYDATLNRLDRVDYADLGVEYKAFNYDDRGNITSNGFTDLTYNRANQMVAAGTDKTYLYDGHNRRVKKDSPQGTEYSLYSQDGTLLYRETGDGVINYIYLGKKLIAKDGFIPTNASNQHYRPYGESIEGAIDDVGYTGHKFDTDLGLSYMQARYYDPVIGRFYSNDPVDALGHMQRGNPIHGFNRYTYANNNPYKYVDPDGEFGIVGALISLGIEGAVQIAQGELNVTKLAAAAVAGGAGVGLGQKAAQLGSLLSNGSKLGSTAAQVTGAVTEAVATNVIETSANNAINSITGANEMENINASGATTNALANTATGNATGNLVSQNTNLSNKKVEGVVTAVVGVAEGARKVMTEVLNDDESK